MIPSSRFYGRRKGRPLHVRKSRLIAEALPQWEISLAVEKHEAASHAPLSSPSEGGSGGRDVVALDLTRLFPFAPRAIWLEIGFGGGEHLAALAKQHPDIGFIGCEPFLNGIASLLDHIDRERIPNIRIFPDDARLLLDALPEASLERCYVLFPDPWPKARHATRRFIGPENMPRFARVLRPKAELRCATDDVALAAWMKAHIAASPAFILDDAGHAPFADWIPTRYMQKGIEAGRKPNYLRGLRRG